MRDAAAPPVIRREDYRAPVFLVDHVDLQVDIFPEITRITSTLQLRRNPASAETVAALRLDGEGIVLREISVDGTTLPSDRYRLDEHALEIPGLPDRCVLRTVGEIDPGANTALEGLYVSHGMYCTQCEAEGFRRITWFPDRPDVLARFRTTISAPRARFPLLLSNGNCVAREDFPDGRHAATWEDPFPKPCYLFALVAGDLACHEDIFVTRSGRRVTLQIFVEPADLDKTSHAMDSLKRAMRWDEDVFGCEYDLDIYMIVAVSHFNMGAMENKGLNVFNTSCVLANPRTQTDKAFQRVEAVIAHEYFHNWSGNRVTCRDWFQLSLKEGFTVFRDAEFSKDMHSRAVKRIEEVTFLRNVQFPEDAGPLAHPVRPESYVEINNFYTVTVYEKGAEVVRMLRTLLGEPVFLRGCRLYFDRHDGQAATCEDFVVAMEDASGVDLGQFRRWYKQAGTPRVVVQGKQDVTSGEYVLTFRQSCPPTPGQAEKLPFVIPVLLGLVDVRDGSAVPVRSDDDRLSARPEGALFLLDSREAELRLRDVDRPVLPSLLREFSAPVRLEFDYPDEQLAFLAAWDADAFNRWNAGQELALRCLLHAVAEAQVGREVRLPPLLLDVWRSALASDQDPALIAEMLALPAESYLADQMQVADPAAVHAVRQAFRRQLAEGLRDALLAAWGRFRPDAAWRADADQIALRALRNVLLDLLVQVPSPESEALVVEQYRVADNMTEQFAALRGAVHAGFACADELLGLFYAQWRHEALVIDQWFAVQVTSPAVDAVRCGEALLVHPDFDLENPNRVRALVASFAGGNPAAFHRADGAGYRFLAEQVMALDRVNPQIAARLAGQFSRWRRVGEALQVHAAAELDRILAQGGLSPNLYEVVHKSRHGSQA